MINKVCYTYYPGEDKALSFRDFETFISCFNLSVEQSKKYFDRVEVYTNKEGVETLSEHLNGVEWVIVDYSKYDWDERFWNFPKLITYSLQREPFIHMDIDSIFMSQPNNLDAPIITEKTRGTAILKQDVYPLLPDDIIKHLEILCSGIIGGNNWKLFYDLYSIAKEPIKKEHNLNTVNFNNLVAIEEVALTHLVKRDGIIYKELDKDSFIHFQGLWKFKIKKEHLFDISALQVFANINGI